MPAILLSNRFRLDAIMHEQGNRPIPDIVHCGGYRGDRTRNHPLGTTGYD